MPGWYAGYTSAPLNRSSSPSMPVMTARGGSPAFPEALALGLGARPLARPEPAPPHSGPPAALRCRSQICMA